MGALATTEIGSGPAVLLIHGLNGFKEGWGPLPEKIAAAGARAVAVDLPGFGSSPRLHRTTPAALADSLGELIGGLAPVALVGHSLGTQVSMLAAAARPGAVRSLVLVSPWILARPMRMPPKSISDVLQLPLVGRTFARFAIGRIRRNPARCRDAYLDTIADPAAFARDADAAALLDEAAERLCSTDLRAMTDWAAAALRLDLRPMAGTIAAPALVVGGTEDRVTKPPGARWLADALPSGTLLEVARAGHFPHLERPDLVLPAIVAATA